MFRLLLVCSVLISAAGPPLCCGCCVEHRSDTANAGQCSHCDGGSDRAPGRAPDPCRCSKIAVPDAAENSLAKLSVSDVRVWKVTAGTETDNQIAPENVSGRQCDVARDRGLTGRLRNALICRMNV